MVVGFIFTGWVFCWRFWSLSQRHQRLRLEFVQRRCKGTRRGENPECSIPAIESLSEPTTMGPRKARADVCMGPVGAWGRVWEHVMALACVATSMDVGVGQGCMGVFVEIAAWCMCSDTRGRGRGYTRALRRRLGSGATTRFRAAA